MQFQHELDTKSFDTFTYQEVPSNCARKVEVYVTSVLYEDCTWLYSTYVEEITPSNLFNASREALEEYPDTVVSMVKF